MLLDQYGQTIRGDFISRRARPDERGQWLTGKIRYANAANDHAEGHIARFLRSPENRHQRRVSVIISDKPCAPDRDQTTPGMSCEEILADILPRQVRLDLYVRHPDGSVSYHDTYVGTGAAVEEQT